MGRMKTNIFSSGSFLTYYAAAFFLISCSTGKELVLKERTDFGVVKFYTQKNLNEKRILVNVDNSTQYRINAKETAKRERANKELTYTLYYGPFKEENDSSKYRKSLSELDSLVLSESDRILDSLNWNSFRRAKEASAFEIEVTYYNGFPRNKKFNFFI
ncbi:hypothetical protein DSM03_101746 [Leeuwenhoekiella aestuarii]|uniref:Lipoprotein n=2 Tax=Leeuwenhoekiella aestuarii TaxID=2249426 RepID=A0A4Q0P0G8_9FLAO|nr:hypothetical protein DSM04_101254 [Leeuwenhoekiella aestuarii]RXG19372.1 hypothetical protein DSM03_101746 [Leeuwenhoekiella aestuarii]